MIVFNHIPRTGGTFLLTQLRRTDLASGREVTVKAAAAMAPRVYLDTEHRPGLLVYHTSGLAFARGFRRRPGDWVFAFLRDRVDMVYSNFAYMKQRVERGDDLPTWTEAMKTHYRLPLERHIDMLIQYKTPDREYPETLSAYDFVGVTERMDESLQVLNDSLGLSLKNGPQINGAEGDKTYRRAELAALYPQAAALYAEACRRLTDLTATADPARAPALVHAAP